MGVNVRVYTIFGVKIPWNDDFNQAYDDVYEEVEESMPGIIIDGMICEYIVLGEKLYQSEDFRYFDGDGDSFTEISPSQLEQIENEFKKKFCEKFPNFKHLVDKPFSLLMFTHYS